MTIVRLYHTREYYHNSKNKKTCLTKSFGRVYLEFQVAYALCLLDPVNEGSELLGHHFANVREGVVMGIRKNTDVSLLEKLYWKQKETDKPWFRHAACGIPPTGPSMKYS